MEIKVENVNQALHEGIHWLLSSGISERSRNGEVIVSPEPVLTEYRFPLERVLFSPKRDANPFFHLMESLWMLAGREDLEWPLYFNSKFGAFSDDGKTVHGAYGDRWRGFGRIDQLNIIAEELRRNPESRRCVLQMWDKGGCDNDLLLAVGENQGKDVPCNTHVYFDVKDGNLNQTVLCRSNDVIWGAYGANAVHFSVLLEYMAAKTGYAVGVYRQFSNNFHIYPAIFQQRGEDARDALHALASDAQEHDHYRYVERDINAGTMFNTPIEDWERDLLRFLDEPTGACTLFNDVFFKECAVPMYAAWTARKRKWSTGLADLRNSDMRTYYPDWYRACTEWIGRREARKEVKSDCKDCGKVPCDCHRVL